MKTFFNLSLSVVILLSALPSPLFAAPVLSQPPLPAAVVLPARQLVAVVTKASPKQQVVALPLNSSQQNCNSPTAAAAPQLLQNSGAINLNQPASCFSLVPGKISALPALAVVTAHPGTVVVASVPKQILPAPWLLPSAPANDAALPVAAVLIFSCIVFERKKNASAAAKKFNSPLYFAGLQQLQIMRC